MIGRVRSSFLGVEMKRARGCWERGRGAGTAPRARMAASPLHYTAPHLADQQSLRVTGSRPRRRGWGLRLSLPRDTKGKDARRGRRRQRCGVGKRHGPGRCYRCGRRTNPAAVRGGQGRRSGGEKSRARFCSQLWRTHLVFALAYLAGPPCPGPKEAGPNERQLWPGGRLTFVLHSASKA